MCTQCGYPTFSNSYGLTPQYRRGSIHRSFAFGRWGYVSHDTYMLVNSDLSYFLLHQEPPKKIDGWALSRFPLLIVRWDRLGFDNVMDMS